MNPTQSNTISNLAAALALASLELKNPPLDKTNPRFGSRYCSLSSSIESTKAILAQHGLSVLQFPVNPGADLIGVQTIIVHASGEFISREFGVPMIIVSKSSKKEGEAEIEINRPMSAQEVGSAITYCRRYSLNACLNIVGDEDDDGETDHKIRSSASVAIKPSAPARPASVPAPAPARPASAPTGTALDTIVHFGKNKGVALRDLPGKSLDWYLNDWFPQPFKGKISDQDAALRAALDEIKSGSGSPAPAPISNENDEVPF